MSEPPAPLTEDLAPVALFVHQHWGIEGAMTRLPGENLNLLIEPPDGAPVVLKVVPTNLHDPGLEEAVLDCLRTAGHVVPGTRDTCDGRSRVDWTWSEVPVVVRLQSFLAGDPWREAGTSPRLLRNIGRTLARMHEDLADLRPPGAARTHQWDLAAAGQWRGTPVTPASRQQFLEEIFQEAAAVIDPVLASCPRGLLHGDANDENILVAGDEVVGVLDFGDCLEGALVQDLAVTLAYALQQPGTGLEQARPLIDGYRSIRELTSAEREVLGPLMRLRLATSAAIAEHRRRENPAHETWFSHETSTWEVIEAIANWSPGRARALLLEEAAPEDRREELARHRARRLGPSLSLSYDAPLHLTKGRGAYLFDAGGRPYLDLVNNVCHVGHSHPRVVSALAAQAATLNTNTRYLHETVLSYADRLVETLPEGLEVCYFVNSGSEANELALRLARSATGSTDALVIDGAYHGHTASGVELSPYKFAGPGGTGKPPWVHIVPMPDVYRGECRDSGAGPAYALEVGRVIGEACAAGRAIAGFFAESMLSCGGQIPLPEGYLEGAFEHVRRAGAVCIADEVQVGFGRMGRVFWGFELAGVVPDIVVLGKPMGNGHPMGAVITTRAIAEAFDTGMEFFSTFGGNPVSAACGLAVMDVIEDEGLQANAQSRGTQLLEGLRDLQGRHSIIGDVRGHGLFVGVELVRDRKSLEPADREAAALVNAMKHHGVLLSTDGPLNNVIKIKPPLVVDAPAIDMALRVMDRCLERL